MTRILLASLLVLCAGSAWACEQRACVDKDGVQHDYCYYRLSDCTERGCMHTMVTSNADGTDKSTTKEQP